MMKRWTMAITVAACLLASSSAALAASAQQQRLEDATDVVRQFVDIPENAIPPALLGEAYGIAVIPSVLKIGFVLGGRRGEGVLSVRTADGSWSNPVFITLTGGSIGWQIGASSTDIILVFKTQRSIDKIANGQISLGADAAVAAGPVGRSAGAATNLSFNAEVYSYARSRGLFAGVSLEGGSIGIDRDSNWLFYDKPGIDALTILKNGDHSNIAQAGQRFVYTLDRYMPAADDFDRDAATRGTSMQPSARGGQSSAGNGGAGQARGQARPYDNGDNNITVRQGNYDAGDNDDSTGGGNRSGGSDNYGAGSNAAGAANDRRARPQGGGSQSQGGSSGSNGGNNDASPANSDY